MLCDLYVYYFKREKKKTEKVQELLQYMSVIRDSVKKHDDLLWHDNDDSQTKASSICITQTFQCNIQRFFAVVKMIFLVEIF